MSLITFFYCRKELSSKIKNKKGIRKRKIVLVLLDIAYVKKNYFQDK